MRPFHNVPPCWCRLYGPFAAQAAEGADPYAPEPGQIDRQMEAADARKQKRRTVQRASGNRISSLLARNELDLATWHENVLRFYGQVDSQ